MATTNRRNLQRASQSRVFTFDGGSGPGVAAVYQGLSRGHGITWAGGNLTPIRVPSDERYGDFVLVDRIRSQRGLPQMNLEFRMTRDASDMLKLFRKGCAIDIQIHVGVCSDPTDFLSFEKIHVMEGAIMTQYQTTELGALDANQEAVVGETLPFEGTDYYEVVPIRDEEIAAAEIVQEVVGVAICDSATCGECGLPSDGCQVIFAVTKSHGGSPGLPAEVIFTADGFQTISTTHVTSLPATMNPSGLACVGTNLVVISNEDDSINYADISDILAGVEVWTRVATGLVAGKAPNAIFSLGRTFTWIVGDGGYIYFSSDITAGVEVQSAGSITVQNLIDIHGWDVEHLVAVGASNALLMTANGGNQTWTGLTGPAIGVQLDSVWMRTEFDWLIGTDAGALYYTRDGGVTWTSKAFPGSGSGKVKDIAFATPVVGYMSHITTAPRGYLLRTVDGGQTWYRLPEAPGLTLADNDGLNSLAVCGDDPNLVYGAGLGANGTDGILLKLA